ncbi:MAG: AAA family ATPase [Chloroflexi bacterium]|nr:AAA family ATPase [Chloroflexota bacterium]
MPIHSLQLTKLGPFRPHNGVRELHDISLEFDRQVNLFIGPNSVGKSTILQTLALIVGGDVVRQRLPSHFKNVLYEWTGGIHPYYWMQWSNQFGEQRKSANLLSSFLTGGTLYGDIGEPGESIEIEVGPDTEVMMRELGYVGYYNPEMQAIEDSHEIIADSVVLEIVSGFSIDILGEVFEDCDIADAQGADAWKLGLEAFGTTDGLVVFPELSHGTRSVLDWVRQFESGMKRYYHGSTDWKKMPGIFIIDEIDAHLHPSWQRRIIPTLQRHFPNVQIFASTHSPMMVAGLKKGQVHLLKRDETGQVVWSRNEQDIIGWTADEIYRTFMGIDDPTDERTARHAEELRVLRNKDNLTPEDEARMQELRRLVNEDLLARGAHNAQQERFDQMMQEYLRSRMSDLSQDGA